MRATVLPYELLIIAKKLEIKGTSGLNKFCLF
jgi:hypothetical protein